MKSSIKKDTFNRIYRLLDQVSPVDYDCGELCGAACCTCQDPDMGIYLLPGEEKMFTRDEDWLSWGWCMAEDYEFICEYIDDKSYEIAQVYLLNLDLNIDEFKLQQEEVAEVKWLSFEEFKKLFYSDEFVRFDDEYREIVLRMLKERL